MDISDFKAYVDQRKSIISDDDTAQEELALIKEMVSNMDDAAKFDFLINGMNNAIVYSENLDEESFNPIFMYNPMTPLVVTSVAYEFLKALPEEDMAIYAARLIATAHLSMMEASGNLVDFITGEDASTS